MGVGPETRRQVLDIVRSAEAPMKPKEIASVLGWPQGRVRSALCVMTREGEVNRSPKSRYHVGPVPADENVADGEHRVRRTRTRALASNPDLDRLANAKREWYRAHLDEPSLASRAIGIEGELAVPVGGKRLGGYIFVADKEVAAAAMKKLRSREGFLDLRYEPGRDGQPDRVRWGEPEPPGLDPEAPVWMHRAHIRRVARFYGYLEAAAYELSGEGPALLPSRPTMQIEEL